MKQFYPLTQKVILYEASQYPFLEPRIETLSLAELNTAKFTPITTLCIPPKEKAKCDIEMLKALNIKISDLQI